MPQQILKTSFLDQFWNRKDRLNFLTLAHSLCRRKIGGVVKIYHPKFGKWLICNELIRMQKNLSNFSCMIEPQWWLKLVYG